MPRIYDIYLDCIVFLYPSALSAKNGRGGGTGFLYGFPSEYAKGKYYLHVVTNKHVVDAAQHGEIYAQFNSKDGKSEITAFQTSNWHFHKGGDDLAVLPIMYPPKDVYKYAFLKDDEHPITDNFIDANDVGAGDDLFMTGRFIPIDQIKKEHRQNNPVVRFGNLAVSQSFPVYNEKTKTFQESYLAEMKSIPGFSGSPVVIYIEPSITRPKDATVRDSWEARLLGVNWGYIPITQNGWLDGDKSKTVSVRLPSNLAGVVPVKRLQEIFMQEELVALRKNLDANLKEAASNAAFEAPNNTEEGELSKEENEDA